MAGVAEDAARAVLAPVRDDFPGSGRVRCRETRHEFKVMDMAQSTAEQRENWRTYECNEAAMVRIAFGPDQIKVAPPTKEVWSALAAVFAAHQYQIRVQDTDSYCCREIRGGSGKSLHSYGIALDVNSDTNPYRRLSAASPVRFSDKATQADRANDVRLNRADTDMTQALIDDILAIRTKDGLRVFEWGGAWSRIKDAMHFEIDLSPDELKSGIDWQTVRGSVAAGESAAGADVAAHPGIIDPLPDDGAALPDDIKLMLQFSGTMAFGERSTQVEILQRALTFLGYQLGATDGIFGSLTREAVFAFQIDNNLPLTGTADEATRAAFARAQKRQLARKRVAADADTLRQDGSRTISAADNTKRAALIASVLGAVGLTNSAYVQFANRPVPKPPTAAELGGLLAQVRQALAAGVPAPDKQRLLEAAKQIQDSGIQAALTPENIQVLEQIRGLLPAKALSAPAVANFFNQVDVAGSARHVSNMFSEVPNWFADGSAIQGVATTLAGVASSFIPGFGGSLAALGIGLAANLFANNVINARVKDHETGANANR